MLGRSESEWLDQLAAGIFAETGAKISRSEIVRAAVAALRELDRVAPMNPSRLLPLTHCKTGAGLLAIRLAATS